MSFHADDQTWRLPPASLDLADQEVHVWRAVLDAPASRLADFAQMLSDDERRRAARFHFERDRAHFIAGRGMLRALLGRYLGAPPASLRFRYGAHGKPELDVPPGADAAFRFNVSHAHGLALYAFTRGRALGVDVERIRDDIEHEAIAERFFSLTEREALRAQPASLRHIAFFACWTRKEAYIKARGEGLSLPLDQFDVSLAPGEPARLLCVANAPHEVARWSLHELHPGPGYAGALMAEGQFWRLACWQYPG